MNKKNWVVVLVLVVFSLPFISSLTLIGPPNYTTEPKNITLNYILDGELNSFDFVVYKGLADYLENLPNTIRYSGNETPSRGDFAIRNINNTMQRDYLLPLISKIKDLDENKENQTRIAISIVQNIPYGGSNKTISIRRGLETNYSRYPYEVLYDNQGLCGEKTELLLFLLKEIGYNTSFFYFPEENHEALGIRCPEKYSLGDSGYCFVETTGPSIISDKSIVYVGDITLESKPEIYVISEGESLPEKMSEYKDAKKMHRIRNWWFMFNKKGKLDKLNKKYGLVSEYNLE